MSFPELGLEHYLFWGKIQGNRQPLDISVDIVSNRDRNKLFLSLGRGAQCSFPLYLGRYTVLVWVEKREVQRGSLCCYGIQFAARGVAALVMLEIVNWGTVVACHCYVRRTAVSFIK